MHVDENDPNVTCGFHNIPENNEYLQLEGKTLFHYVDRKGSKYNKSVFPNFFYTIEVSSLDSFIPRPYLHKVLTSFVFLHRSILKGRLPRQHRECEC